NSHENEWIARQLSTQANVTFERAGVRLRQSLTGEDQTDYNRQNNVAHNESSLLFLFLLLQGLRFVRIPVLQMTVLAGFIDAVTRVQEAFHVFLLDRLKRFHRRIVEPVRKLDPRRPVLIDEPLDVLGV